MERRLYLFASAIVIGLVLLLTDVSTTAATGRSIGCGTALHPRTAGSAADMRPDLISDELVLDEAPASDAQRCVDAVSARQVWAWLFVGVGVLGVVISLVRVPRRDDDPVEGEPKTM